MKIRVPHLLLLITLVSFSVCAQEGAKSKRRAARGGGEQEAMVVTVNEVGIPKSRLDAILKERAAMGQRETEETRKAALDELINREILVQEANRKGFSRNPDVRAQMELARQAILVRAVLQDIVKKTSVTDEALKAEYEKIKAQLGDKEYKARHILVEKESEAKDIISKLKRGEKMEDLASASKDPGSKDKGGDLGWNVPANYVPPFAAALTKLQKGQFTQEPVKSQFGYHIILLEDTRPSKIPSFDEAKGHLVQQFQQQTLEKAIADLRSKAKVEYN